MDSAPMAFVYDDVPELTWFSDRSPSTLGLAACLESLEIDAELLGKRLTANLIGAARLALLER